MCAPWCRANERWPELDVLVGLSGKTGSSIGIEGA
jgi:hypothetical protein